MRLSTANPRKLWWIKSAKQSIWLRSLSLFHVMLHHTVPIIFYTPLEQFDTRLVVWNLKFNSKLLSWCVFNSYDISEAPDQTDCIHNMKAESIQVFLDTFYPKVITTVKFNPKRFFFKKESMNYFHNVFSTLTSPHRHEDENNLKTDMKKKHTFVLTLLVPISQNGQTHSNNLSAICQQIVWKCFTILWEWRLKS